VPTLVYNKQAWWKQVWGPRQGSIDLLAKHTAIHYNAVPFMRYTQYLMVPVS